jgi:hypothetical protein
VKRPRELISHPKAHTSRFASFVCIAAQVTQGEAGARFFAAVAFQWGLVADVDIESESMRCLGGLRFTVQAILRIIHLRKCAPAREREREREREGERESGAGGLTREAETPLPSNHPRIMCLSNTTKAILRPTRSRHPKQ